MIVVGCGKIGRPCGPNSQCDSGKCYTNTQCSSSAQCPFGATCNDGYCTYTELKCGINRVCPKGYLCDSRSGQCVFPPPKNTCPEGFQLNGYWCAPIGEPQCGYSAGGCGKTNICIEVCVTVRVWFPPSLVSKHR